MIILYQQQVQVRVEMIIESWRSHHHLSKNGMVEASGKL